MMTNELRDKLIAIRAKVAKDRHYQPTAAEVADIRRAALARQAEGRVGIVERGEQILRAHMGR